MVATETRHLSVDDFLELLRLRLLVFEEGFSYFAQGISNRMQFPVKGKLNKEVIKDGSCHQALYNRIHEACVSYVWNALD